MNPSLLSRSSRIVGWLVAILALTCFSIGVAQEGGVSRANAPSDHHLVSFEVVDAPARLIIDALKTQAEVEIIYNADDLRGKVLSLSLKQKPVEFVLDLVCEAAGVRFYKKSGVYIISKSVPAPAPTEGRNDPPMPGGGIGRKPEPEKKPTPLESLIPKLTNDEPLPMPRIDSVPKLNPAEKIVSRKIELKHLSVHVISRFFNPDAPDLNERLMRGGLPSGQFGPGFDQLSRAGAGVTAGASPFGSTYGGGENGLLRSNRSQLIAPSNGGGFGGLGGGLGGGGLGGGGLGGGGLGGGGGAGGAFPRPAGIESIIAFDPLNALIVRGTESAIQELQELIDLLDKPLKQVLIEAQFVDVSTTVSDNFAIQWQLQQGPFNISVFPGVANGGDLQVGYVRGSFQATLGMLQSQNKAKTVQSPRAIAMNNSLALLTSTEVQWIIVQSTTAAIGGQNQQSRIPFPIQIPISLTAIPTINGDGTVTVALAPTLTISTPINVDGITVPRIRTSFTLVNVNMRDGDTVVVGGLVQNTRSAATSKIPFLGDLPLVGSIFRTRNNILGESELLIFVTVKILPSPQEEDAAGLGSGGRAGGGL